MRRLLEGFRGGLVAVAALLVLGVLSGAALHYGVPDRLAGSAASSVRHTEPLSSVHSGRVMVAVVFGQSNAANSGETRYRSRERVLNFYRGKLYRARDPLLGATGRGGSVWTRLGDRLIREGLYDAVVFVPLGVGATAIARWTPGGDLHPKVLEAVREVRASGLNVTHLLWHQGESDVGRTSTRAYRRMFLEMLASLRSVGVDVPIYVSVATLCHGQKPGTEAVRQAQRGLVDPYRNIYAGPDTDRLGLSYRYDRCHFSTEGLGRFAELWLEALTPKE